MTADDGVGEKARATNPRAETKRGPARRPTRWIAVALRLFPAAWRHRYGAEFAALLEQTPVTARVLSDVVVAAVHAHVHPTGPRRRWPLVIDRLRISELTVFASWVVFVVTGLVFQRVSEDGPASAAGGVNGAVALAAVIVMGGAIASLGAVAVAGLPVAFAILRRALRCGDGRTLGLLAVPPLVLAVWAALSVVVLGFNIPDGSVWRLVALLVWTGAFGLAALASAVAVSAAALGSEIDPSLYRRAVGPALAATTAMAIVVTAVVTWGIALAVASPSTFWGSDGLLGTSTIVNWLAIVGVMGGATMIGGRAALRARSERAA